MGYSSEVLERPAFLERLVEQAVPQARSVRRVLRVVPEMNARFNFNNTVFLIKPRHLVVLIEHDVYVRAFWRMLFGNFVGHRFVTRAGIGVDRPRNRMRCAATTNLQTFGISLLNQRNDLVFIYRMIEPVSSYGDSTDSRTGTSSHKHLII